MAKAKPFDAAEYLDSPEMIAAYLTEALESSDQALITKAIGNVARARGMSEVAEKAGVSRENLYRALRGEAKPEFDTIMKVLRALEINLVAQPRAAA
jgi:probable addiction module antidote protein